MRQDMGQVSYPVHGDRRILAGMKTQIYHRWRVKGLTGKWHTTSYHATEERIRIEHPEAQAVPFTRIERQIPETPLERELHEIENGTAPSDDRLRKRKAELKAKLEAQRGQDSTRA